jgi:prephenate dehydrogenase
VALPISTTLDVLPEIARHSAQHVLVTDACSTKARIVRAAEELFPPSDEKLFLGGHPMAGKESSGIANADANLFRDTTYAFIGKSSSSVDDVAAHDESAAQLSPAGIEPVPPPSARSSHALKEDPRVDAFLKIIAKIGARPLWLGAQQHDYAVGLASHLPQLAAVALASFLYDHLDENGLPIALAGPGLRDSLRLAGSPYSTWRDIVLTNREVLSAGLDLFARRLDELREKLASRELEADFDAANELYKLLRSF